jgi:hypothetical protein
MMKVTLLSLFAILFLATFANSQCVAPCLFYAGDFDPNNDNSVGLSNESDAHVFGNPYGAATYQNFNVSGAGWNVTGLYTNNLSSLNPATGYWEIRQGLSDGNGGTLLASGTGAVTQTPTGRFGLGLAEYNDLVSGLNLTLTPGLYWMAVVPQDPNGPGRSYNTNTFGLNQVGSELSNEQFWNSPFAGTYFTNQGFQGIIQAFSAGVVGTPVPEPSSLMMLGSGLLAAVGVVRRRLFR